MKKFLPTSLVGKLLAFMALMLLVAQAINMVLLYQAEQRQGLQQAVSTAIFRFMAEIDRTDRQSPGMRRQQGAQPFRIKPLVSYTKPDFHGDSLPEISVQAALELENLGIAVRSIDISQQAAVPALLKDHIIRPNRKYGRGHRALAQDVEISGGQPSPRFRTFVIMSVQLENGQWLSLASAVRDRRGQVLRPLILQTLLTYLILLVPLILLARYISKPLKSLTQAVENFRAGKSMQVTQGGPPDVRKLISAHNDMNEKVNAMLDEKDVMLGAIGHDLRTPLATLRVRIESVDNEDEREHMVSVIADMEQMLDDILSLARVGKTSEKPEVTDINALIQMVAGEFVDLGFDVKFDGQGRVEASVKRPLIRRALRNLISNAVKYGKSAKISTRIADNQIQIDIEDEGPGIDDNMLETMFEPFARAETSRNRQTGGIGLGLTLARTILRNQGGDIVIQNRNSSGLRARVILPTFDLG